MTLKEALTERFAMARSRVWESPRARRNMKRGARGAAFAVAFLTFEEMMAGCGLEGAVQQPGASANPTPIDAKPSAGPVPGSNEVAFMDSNTQLFLKASLDYKSLNTSEKASLTVFWNDALDQMQGLTSLDNHTGDNILFYRENGDTPAKGEISKNQITHPLQMGKIITFKDSDGKTKDLGYPQFNPSDGSVSYTSKDQHMIPGFYGGYVKVGNQYVFAELFPNASKVVPESGKSLQQTVDGLKSSGYEVEGNDKLGYYQVDGYRVALFQVDGKHKVAVMATDAATGLSRGGAFGKDMTAEQFITGNGNSNGEMGNDRTGRLVVIVYGGSGDANKQLLNYARTGNDKPAFVLDDTTQVTTSKDANGQTVYNVGLPTSLALDNLPYIEGAITKTPVITK